MRLFSIAKLYTKYYLLFWLYPNIYKGLCTTNRLNSRKRKFQVQVKFIKLNIHKSLMGFIRLIHQRLRDNSQTIAFWLYSTQALDTDYFFICPSYYKSTKLNTTSHIAGRKFHKTTFFSFNLQVLNSSSSFKLISQYKCNKYIQDPIYST